MQPISDKVNSPSVHIKRTGRQTADIWGGGGGSGGGLGVLKLGSHFKTSETSYIINNTYYVQNLWLQSLSLLTLGGWG